LIGFDIVIIGGGLSGSSTALNLSKRGYSVLIIEKEKYQDYKPCAGGMASSMQRLIPLDIEDSIESKIKNVSSLKQEIRTWKSLESNLNLDVEDKNLYINSAKDISVGKITSFFKSDSQIKGLAMIKRKYLEEGSCFFSEIFGKIIINKSVGSIFL